MTFIYLFIYYYYLFHMFACDMEERKIQWVLCWGIQDLFSQLTQGSCAIEKGRGPSFFAFTIFWLS